MTWVTLQLFTAAYLAGLLWFHRQRWTSVEYIWGALGFIFIVLHLASLGGWHIQLATLEAQHMRQLLALGGLEIDFVNDKILLIPDSNGWVGLDITLECSTLIELSIFSGLILFYPRLNLRQRFTYFVIGVIATYILNLIRIGIIIAFILIGDRSTIPLTHNLIARGVYFVGIIAIYWYLLTRPTLSLIRRSVETQGLGVD